jgi:hypothetical protein
VKKALKTVKESKELTELVRKLKLETEKEDTAWQPQGEWDGQESQGDSQYFLLWVSIWDKYKLLIKAIYYLLSLIQDQLSISSMASPVFAILRRPLSTNTLLQAAQKCPYSPMAI